MATEKATIIIEGDSKGAIKAIDKLVGALEKLPGLVSSLTSATKSLEKTITSSMSSTSKAAEKFSGSMETTEKKLKDAGTAASDLSRKVKTLATDSDKAGGRMASVGAGAEKSLDGVVKKAASAKQAMSGIMPSMLLKRPEQTSFLDMSGNVRPPSELNPAKQLPMFDPKQKIDWGSFTKAPANALQGLVAEWSGYLAQMQIKLQSFSGKVKSGASEIASRLTKMLPPSVQAQGAKLFSGIANSLSSMKAASTSASSTVSSGLAAAFGKSVTSGSMLQAIMGTLKGSLAELGPKAVALGASMSKAFAAAIPIAMKFSSVLLKNVVGALLKVTTSIARSAAEIPLKMGKMLESVRQSYMAVANGLRMVAQGVTNLGRTLTFFVSLPLVAFFKQGLGAAIDFDDALVRVRKTANLSSAALAEVRVGIRELARWTSTSHVELATMAEQLGQLGIESPERIVQYTDIMNKLAVTTDLTSESVANAVGKIGNAFGWDLDAEGAVDNVRKLANVINYLENQTAASADEIVEATLRSAQAATQLKFSPQSVIAMNAALISMGFSASEAGTAFRNMTFFVSKNAEEFANLMGNTDKYADKQKVLRALTDDASGVFIDLFDAVNDGNNDVEEFVSLMEIGGLRGGRGLAALGGNLELVLKSLRDATSEWETGQSLEREYEMALLSTQSQWNILKNNINDVGITIGTYVLPYVNKLVQMAVPAVRMLGDAFEKASPRVKNMVLALGFGLVVGGPLLLMFGQIMHTVFLIASGVGYLLRVFSIAFISMGKLVSTFGVLFTSVPGLIIAGLAGVLVILHKAGVDIAGFFTSIAERASAWGASLMETYGNGIAKAASFVLQIVSQIAGMIAGFFESHSPPKMGPLSTIDKWGSSLMRTFLEGFKNADFDVLNSVGRTIERILTSAVPVNDEGEGLVNALRMTASARTSLAKLVDAFNRTGEISSGIMSEITAGLGQMGQDISKLISLWLEYNKIQERIAALEEKRKQINSDYAATVSGIVTSDMSAEEKVAAVRSAKQKQFSDLQAVDVEQAGLEEQADGMKDSLDWQKSFIDGLLDQDDLMRRIAETLQRMADALERAGGAGGDAGGGFSLDPDGTIEKFQEEIAKAEEKFQTFRQAVEEGGARLNAIIAGFKGEDMLPLEAFSTREEYDQYVRLYEIGAQIGDVWERVSGIWDTISTIVGGVVEAVDRIRGGESIMDVLFGKGKVSAPKSNPITDFIDKIRNFDIKDVPILGPTLKAFIGPVSAGFYVLTEVLKELQPMFERLQEHFQRIADNPRIQAFIDRIGQSFQFFFGILGTVVGFLAGVVVGAIVGFVGILTFLWGMIMEIALGIGDAVYGAVDLFLTKWEEFYNWAKTAGADIVTGIIDGLFGEGAGQKFVEWITGVWNDLLTWLGIQSPSVKGNEMGGNIVQGIIDGILALTWEPVWTWIEGKWEELKGLFETGAQNILDYLQGNDLLQKFLDAGSGIFQGIWDGMLSIASSIETWFGRVVDSWPDWIKTALNMNSPSKVMEELGKNTMLGYLIGLQGIEDKIRDAMTSIVLPDTDVAFESTFGLGGFSIPLHTGDNRMLRMEVAVNHPVVREEQDIRKIADSVADAVERKLGTKTKQFARAG